MHIKYNTYTAYNVGQLRIKQSTWYFFNTVLGLPDDQKCMTDAKALQSPIVNSW